MTNVIQISDFIGVPRKRDPKCRLTYDAQEGSYDCGYETNLTCDQCKYGVGRKDPEAKCNKDKK